jgi:hypothetical protein
MKRKWISLVSLFVLVAGALGQLDDFDPLGENETIRAVKMVRCTVELIDVPTAFLSEAVAEEAQTLPNDARLWKRARELAAKGEDAKLLDSVVLMTKPGVPSLVGSILDNVHITKYDPPPASLAGEKNAAEESQPAPKTPAPASPAGAGPQPPSPPVDSEHMKVGCSVELDAVVGLSGDIIEFAITVENVTDLGEDFPGNRKDDRGEIPMKIRRFHIVKLKTQATIPNGHVFLVGAASPADEKGKLDSTRKVLAFAKMDLVSPVERKKP